jgi:hypothetical protein
LAVQDPPRHPILRGAGDTIRIRLVDAATGRPIADSEVEVYTDNGIRCVTAPCPTDGLTWRGRSDAQGVVAVPKSAVNVVAHIGTPRHGMVDLGKARRRGGVWVARLVRDRSPPAVEAGEASPVVIYLHGRIIEDQGPAAVSPEFGAYEYHAILDSLRAAGLVVLGEVRPRGTDMDRYAERVAAQVDSLLGAGVPPAGVAVIGFSKGGGIAMRASARLRRTDLTFVFLASCGGGDPGLVVAGRILSVYEESDSLGRSCGPLFARARRGSVHSERQIRTGKGHGAFYRPRPEWLAPVRAWIRRVPLGDPG